MIHSLSTQGFRAIRSPASMPRRLATAAIALLIVSVAPGLDDPLNLGPDSAWAQGRSNDAPGRSGDSPGRSGDAPGRSGGSSGNSGSAPGQSGGSPGSSGSAPGQSGGSPGNSGNSSSGGGPSSDNDRSPGNSGSSSGRGGGSDRSDAPWNGNDRAVDRRSSNAAPTANARGRYNALATTPAAQTVEVAEESEDDNSFSERIGDVAVELDAEATQALIESGWSAAGSSAPETASAPAYAFEDQSERIRTFVILARELNARYGGQPGFEEIPIAAAALQASFGTPWEAGILRRPERREDGTPVGPNDRPATTDEVELQRRIDQMKPGDAPVDGWERMTELDVNGDGFVDRKDLIDLQLGVTPAFLEGSR